MMMSRLLRSKLPTKQSLLQPKSEGKVWEPAVVRSAHVNPRSYLVQSQHGQLRRNRRHLSETNELPPLFLPAVETASVDHPLTTPCVDARQLREVPAAPPEPADT
ncbi:hypothetical protein NP493_1347g00026 [Ridgeia piscesae]|uniref:Uncharacterized protein n=1 Tax=Ridgeia piscesae TaxID=27915 RepID=A0AAD9K7C5_RIDPI|nr:hypothetical protein NP493_1347g00026 [Ridgeia piscesae]